MSTYVAKGANALGTTSCTPGYPAGLAADDLILCAVQAREAASASASMPAGWTLLASVAGTFGTVGAGTGPTKMWWFTKDTVTGSESGTVTVTVTSGTVCIAAMFAFRSATGAFDIAWASGEDTSAGTTISAVCSPNGGLGAGWITAGDLLFGHIGKPITTGTISGQTFASSGLTMGATTEVWEYSSTNGNDLESTAWWGDVTSGTQSVSTVTASAAVGTSTYGPALVLRLRDAVSNDLDGVVAATSGTSGTLQAIPLLAGTAAVTSTTSGDLQAIPLLAGSSAAVSDTSGTITTAAGLSGSSDAVSGASGTLLAIRVLSGTSPASSATSGILNAIRVLSGQVSAVVTTQGDIQGRYSLSGEAASVSSISGMMTVAFYLLEGVLSAVSTTRGTMKGGASGGAGSMTNADLEYAYYISLGGERSKSLLDLRRQYQSGPPFAYWSGLSGLTPATSYSVEDHKRKTILTALALVEGTPNTNDDLTNQYYESLL